jgi:hypothetical protein
MSIENFKAKIKKHNNHTLLAELKARLDHAGARPEALALLEELSRRYEDDDVGGMELPPPWVGLAIVLAIGIASIVLSVAFLAVVLSLIRWIW